MCEWAMNKGVGYRAEKKTDKHINAPEEGHKEGWGYSTEDSQEKIFCLSLEKYFQRKYCLKFSKKGFYITPQVARGTGI